jgi:peptide deformylase
MLKLVEPNHPAIITRCTTDPFELDDVKSYEQDMLTLMGERFGVGLSSNQVGHNYRMFVMHHTVHGEIGVYNPEIIGVSDKSISIEEGCLTFPLLFVILTRPAEIKVKYQNADKEVVEEELSGIDARCFLHEYDHLEGKVFLEHASDMKLQRAIKKRDKNIKKLIRQQMA